MKTRPVHIFIGLILAFVAFPVVVMFASNAGKAVSIVKDRFNNAEVPVMAASTDLELTEVAITPVAPEATDTVLEKSLPEGLPPAEIGLPPQDMALSATSDKTQVKPGDPVTFTFTVTNYGTEPVPSVFLYNDLPVELTSPTATTDHGTVAVEGQAITADLGTMAAGEQALVTVTAVVSGAPEGLPELINIGVMEVGSTTDDTSNNVAMVPVTVGSESIASSVVTETAPIETQLPAGDIASLPEPAAPVLNAPLVQATSEPMPLFSSQPVTAGNITVAESSNIDSANIGENVIFTLDVTNPTTASAPNVVLEKEVPETFQILDVQTDKGTVEVEGNMVRINIGDMPANSESLVTITTQIQSTALVGTVADTNTNVITEVHGLPAESAIQQPIMVNAPADLPTTGFAPGRVTTLTQPSLSENSDYNMVLTVPVLGVQTGIWGISQYQGQWDLGYLFNLAGHLQGTVKPGAVGNSVLTGHVTNADGQPGIFAKLNTLIPGDAIYLHADGKTNKYQVVDVEYVGSQDGQAVLKPSTDTLLTLLTCHDFDPNTGLFNQRVVVTAKLVK